ncbi:E3 SUMO-protein ligase NSE2 [Biomphalaria glabrata]
MASSKSMIEAHAQVIENNFKECINSCFEGVLDVGQNLSEFSLLDNKDFVTTSESMMKGFIEMEKEMQHHIAALKDVRTLTSSDGIDVNFLAEFDKKLDHLKKSSENDYKSHPKYKELENFFMDVGSLEEQIAALRVKLTASSSNDDIEVTEVEINTKCPYTGQTIVFPVRNKHCGHVYDKAGITNYISSRKAKAKCPAVGCGNKNPITVDILEEHTDLKKYIQLVGKLERLKVNDNLDHSLDV